MSRIMPFSWSVMVGLIVFSCDPGDTPIPPKQPAEAQIAQLEMGSDYGQQLFFDLESGEVVAQNTRTTWDLLFSCIHPEGALFLNGSKRMLAYPTGDTTLNAAVDLSSADWQWDHPTGAVELGVFANWADAQGSSKREVYVLDLGLDLLGLPLGYLKIQIESFDGNAYVIRTAAIDGTNIQSYTIPLNPALNGVAFNLTDGAVVAHQPPSDQWDLLFSNYMETLWDGSDSVYYQVNGVLLNRNGVAVSVVDAPSVDSVSIDPTELIAISSNINAIGYQWKFFDFDTQTFAVEPNRVYIIRTVEENFYALRFLGFYSPEGVKGSPEFEFKLL